MKPLTFLFFILSTVLLSSCNESLKKSKNTDDPAIIYYGGDIITMEGETPQYSESVVVANGKIIYEGDLKTAENRYKNSTKFNLDGRTLLPGFIEPHLHPSLAAIMLQNEIIAPYDWKLPSGTKEGVQREQAYRNRISESIKSNAILDQIYFIWGYHQLWHGELSRDLLNTIAGNQPVGIIHRSFHEIYLNDAAITKLGIKESDFINNPQVNWSKGHFFEGGWLALVPKMAPILLEPTSYLKGLSTMSELLRQNGITTIAEPGFPSSDFDGELKLLMKEMENNPPYDVYLIPSGTQLYGMKGGNEEAMSFMETLDTVSSYNRTNVKFLPKQVKLFSDGAIYSQLMQMKDGYTDGHHGEWMTPLDLFEEQLMMYWNNDYRIHVHSNGDLGQQMVIDLVKKAQKTNPRKDHRLTLHHMGYFDESMTREMADLGIEASVNPYYLWALADKYAEFGLGSERAENLVALKLLTDQNIPLSFHSDFSMAPVEPLTLVWTAVNRQTSQGSKFSQDQRISVFDALKAITIDAARTLNLENEIGSLKLGKNANFTILNENPFKIDPLKIKDINIVGIIYKGDFHNANQPQMIGSWEEIEINQDVKDAVNFVFSQINKDAKLKRVLSARKQIVNGTNYDLTFELENGEIWKGVVYKTLKGDYSISKEFKQTE
ncbi:MAG: amidohydrolase family protein [Cyclobacteriaceae bacterium]|nr:amidohydrolase family protein [Cyclobacteriaceae bacterium]